MPYIGGMNGQEFRDTLKTLGIGQTELARWLDSDGSTVRRYIYGKRKVPTSLALLLEYLRDRPEAIQWFRDRAATISKS